MLDESSSPLIMPGDAAEVKMWLRRPMVLKQGQRFSLRENQFTALTGVVTEFLPSHDEELAGFTYMPRTTLSNMTEAQQKKAKSYVETKKKK